MAEPNIELEKLAWEKQRFKYMLIVGTALATFLLAMMFQFYAFGSRELRDYQYQVREIEDRLRTVEKRVELLDAKTDSVLSESASVRTRVDTLIESVRELETRVGGKE